MLNDKVRPFESTDSYSCEAILNSGIERHDEGKTYYA